MTPGSERRLRVLAVLLVPVVALILLVSLVVGVALLVLARVLAVAFRLADRLRERPVVVTTKAVPPRAA